MGYTLARKCVRSKSSQDMVHRPLWWCAFLFSILPIFYTCPETMLNQSIKVHVN